MITASHDNIDECESFVPNLFWRLAEQALSTPF